MGGMAERRAQRRAAQNTTTTTAVLTPEQKGLIAQAYPTLKGFTPPQLPTATNDLVAPFNPTQVASQGQALSNVPTQQATVSGANAANQQLTNPAILSPDSNPALQAWQAAATRPITDNYMETVMPQIRSAATQVGQYGSSRHGVAEGIAAKGYLNAVGDTNANIANQGYSQGLQAMLSAMGMAPSTAAGMNIPAATTGAVGDVQQQQTQAGMDAVTGAKWQNAMAPWLLAQDQAAIAAGLPGGSTTVQAPQPRGSLIANAAGGALSGAAFGRPLLGAALGAASGIGTYFA